MRYRVLALMPVCFALFASNTNPSDLLLINRLDDIVQLRFKAPSPGALGMSRVATPASMGKHFLPLRLHDRDFISENATEQQVIANLEQNGIHVGLYVFGEAVVTAPSQALNYRALKGPGIITTGTPRPAWYPGQLEAGTGPVGALPDWKTIYPLAKRAMQSFQDGGAGFETSLESWVIAARPVLAEQRCNACHNASAPKANRPIGGVLYAFRRNPS